MPFGNLYDPGLSALFGLPRILISDSDCFFVGELDMVLLTRKTFGDAFKYVCSKQVVHGSTCCGLFCARIRICVPTVNAVAWMPVAAPVVST